MKRGKEIKIDTTNNLNVIFGTVDNKNPKSVYITISGWADPKIEDEVNYGKIIRNIHKQIKHTLHNNGVNYFFDLNKTIVDFDMRESGIIFGKRSYMCCEITLFQINNYPLTSSELQTALVEVLNLIVRNNLAPNEHFEFHKTKD